jgi:hypothetical protein
MDALVIVMIVCFGGALLWLIVRSATKHRQEPEVHDPHMAPGRPRRATSLSYDPDKLDK